MASGRQLHYLSLFITLEAFFNSCATPGSRLVSYNSIKLILRKNCFVFNSMVFAKNIVQPLQNPGFGFSCKLLHNGNFMGPAWGTQDLQDLC